MNNFKCLRQGDQRQGESGEKNQGFLNCLETGHPGRPDNLVQIILIIFA